MDGQHIFEKHKVSKFLADKLKTEGFYNESIKCYYYSIYQKICSIIYKSPTYFNYNNYQECINDANKGGHYKFRNKIKFDLYNITDDIQYSNRITLEIENLLNERKIADYSDDESKIFDELKLLEIENKFNFIYNELCKNYGNTY